MLLNKGLTNSVEKKAVPCDLIAEILKLKDTLLQTDETFAEEYEQYYEDDFENCDQEDYILGDCIQALTYSDTGIKDNVAVYSGELYFNHKGKYQGKCKLPNGADIIVLEICCEEEPTSMCKVLYFDGEKLKLFTPYEGNAVNVALRTCLLDEEYMHENNVDEKYLKQIYPDGLDLDWKDKDFEDYELFRDTARRGYAKFLGIDMDDFENGDFKLNWDAICNEIETVLG